MVPVSIIAHFPRCVPILVVFLRERTVIVELARPEMTEMDMERAHTNITRNRLTLPSSTCQGSLSELVPYRCSVGCHRELHMYHRLLSLRKDVPGTLRCVHPVTFRWMLRLMLATRSRHDPTTSSSSQRPKGMGRGYNEGQCTRAPSY